MNVEFKGAIWVCVLALILFMDNFNQWPREDAITFINVLCAGYILFAIISTIDFIFLKPKREREKLK